MQNHFLNSFFYPRSIAVIGASNKPETLSFNLFYNLVYLGFKGNLYPVNPNIDEIMGIRVYKSLKDINEDIELVISAIPVEKTLDIIIELIMKKVKAVVIIAGGFSEIGEDGRKIQNTIALSLKNHGIRAIGPNTLSPVCFSSSLAISFRRISRLRCSSVSFIFQSGMYDPRLNWLFNDFHLGINKLIDLGNKMDVDEADVLEYLANDDSTKVIGMHIEALKSNGRRFIEILRNTTKKKPVIILKGGRSKAGANAAASHTGSIIQHNDFIFDGVIKQAGAIRAENLEDLFDYAKAFEYMSPPSGTRCAIGSFSGGEGVLATDICNQEGFSISTLDAQTIEKIGVMFPPWQISVNPLDLGICFQFFGANNFFNTYLMNMANDPNTDCMVVQFPDVQSLFSKKDLYKSFLAVKDAGKTIVSWATSINDEVAKPIERFELNQIPVYPSAGRAIKSLSAIYRHKIMNCELD